MAKYRSIQTAFWSDSKIIDDFTPEDRYFYLYLLTNEKSNQLGCYELSIKQICRDTGYNEETVKKLLERFENVLEVINYDYKTKEIFLKNWHKYNWLNSENTKKCIEKEFDLIKSTFLKDLISPLYAPYIPLPSNKKKKKKKKNNKKNNNMEEEEKEEEVASQQPTQPTTPTIEKIISLGKELGVDEKYCNEFFKYYNNREWKNKGGKVIDDWTKVFAIWVSEDLRNGKIKKTPEWFDKLVVKEEVGENELNEIEELLAEFK